MNARERVGTGPWANRNGVTIAESLEALHALAGDADLFIDDERHED